MKALVIGGTEKEAKTLWKDAEVETMDANPENKATYTRDAQTMPEELYERYDVVLASHVLEHVPYWEVHKVLAEWAKVLKPGGEMHVIVPSLEWAAQQIAIEEKPSPALLQHLHGGIDTPWNIHLCSFTMRALRSVFEMAGLAVVRARTGPYHIMAYDKEYMAEQHYICGIKKETTDDGISGNDAGDSPAAGNSA